MKTVVVYKKSKSSKKHFMLVQEGNQIDQINNAGARQPIIPHDYDIVELGWGEGLIDLWMRKYSINGWTNSIDKPKQNKNNQIF